MNGARSATSAMPARITSPPTKVGLRLMNRHIFAARPGLSIAPEMVSTVASAISIPDPRIEYGVSQVDDQVDDHVDAGEHEDHALDDRIITLGDRIDHQSPDP